MSASPANAPLFIDVDDKTFDTVVLASETPVLVLFYAHWDSPSRDHLPVVEQLLQEFAGRVIGARVDMSAVVRTPNRYTITAIPMVLFFVRGVVKGRVLGTVTLDELRAALNTALA